MPPSDPSQKLYLVTRNDLPAGLQQTTGTPVLEGGVHLGRTENVRFHPIISSLPAFAC